MVRGILWNIIFLLIFVTCCFINQSSSVSYKLYALERHDGCGSTAQHLFHGALYAIAFGYDIGGILSDTNGYSFGHGVNCTSMIAKIGNFCGSITTQKKSIVGTCKSFDQSHLDQVWSDSNGVIRGERSSCAYINSSYIFIKNIHIEHYYTKKFSETIQQCFEDAQKNPDTSLFQLLLSDHMDIISHITEEIINISSTVRPLQVVMHIRRGDVNDPQSSRWTPLSWYVNITHALHSLKRYKHAQFHVVSEGDTSDFPDFENLNITFHLNESMEDTWGRMILADVLIMAKSSFSYAVAVLAYAELVLYEPFWHAPLPWWVNAIDFLEQPSLAHSKPREGIALNRARLYNVLESQSSPR